MIDLMDFHFLRPLWLMTLIPLIILSYKFLQAKHYSSGWEHLIPKDLLQFLTVEQTHKQSLRLPILIASTLMAIVIVALAGPAWKKIPQAVFQNQSALIIALDLSPSMFAQDNAPSRIRRAQLKIQALLERRKEGLTALLVYAGEAHTVTPFTDDNNTISNLLPTLNPGLLPIPGSNTEMAIEFATTQLLNSGLNRASLLLVTDGVEQNAANTIIKQWDKRLSLTILGLGTEAGAPIPTTDGYITDTNGEWVIAKRNSQTLQNLAAQTNGYYLPLQADDSDIEFIERVIERDFATINDQTNLNQDQQYDQWHEFGPTLLLIFLPLAALLFRRGWLLGVVLCGPFLVLGAPQQAHASLWESLWKTQDQRGYKAWQAEDYSQAEQLFSDKQWQGSAAYKNKNYEAALEAFKLDESAEGYFNQGNALANLARIDEAILAYDKALSINPDFTAAAENKRHLEELRQEQQQQAQQEKNQQQEQQQNNKENSESTDEQSNVNEDRSQQDSTPPSNENEQSKSNQNGSEDQQQEQQQEQTNDNSSIGQIPLPDDLTTEEQQAMQQWLRKIPDDPSGLLRRKFEYEFDKRRQLYQQGQWELPDNNAHQRY